MIVGFTSSQSPVSLCVREWIETYINVKLSIAQNVSLCVREWIETSCDCMLAVVCRVSLCVREWIETICHTVSQNTPGRSPSA